MAIVIRTESEEDYEAVFQLNAEAFGNREDESRLIERIRSSERFIPELSLVAEENGEIVGHALFSGADLADDESGASHDVIVLAPIAVSPSRQKSGIGGMLILEGFKRCEERGDTHVFLIGHPTYYPRFGFEPAGRHGFVLKQFEVPEDVFMVYRLPASSPAEVGGAAKAAGPWKGELKYPAAFFS